MNELKTLKDIEYHENWSSKKGYDIIVNSNTLKQEEWIKSIEQEQRDLGNYQKNNNKKDYYNFNPRKQGMISFIKKFFNLTKEDLKGEKKE